MIKNNPDIKFTMMYSKSIDGGFYGLIKELPGVGSQGESMEELEHNLWDAIKLYFHHKKNENVHEEMEERELCLA